MRRIIFLAVLALLVTVLGCGKNGGTSADSGEGEGVLTPTPGGILIWGRGADATKLDPGDITDGESVKVCNQIFETLVTYAEDSAALVPCLAEKWQSAEGGKVWTFQLRKGVTFHDGTAFDAEAVLFTFERHTNEKSEYRFEGAFSYSPNYHEIVKVEAPDAHTVVFTLQAPSAVFLPNLAMFPAAIVSPSAVRKHGDRFHVNPVGTGPFRFVKWVRDVKILLEANKDYWGEKPLLDKVIFKPVPENAARLEQLKRGEINIMDNFSLSDIELIEKDEALVFDKVTGMNFAYLALNNDHPPFDKKEVRLAVAHAIDKAKLVKLAAFGIGTPGLNPMPPSVWGYHDGIQEHPYDPERAKELLAKAGFPDGFETELWAMPNPRPYMPRPKEAAQIIKECLAAVSIKAKIISHPWTVYLDKTKNGEHPMCVLGWTTDNGDPDNFLWVLLSKENAVKGSAQNVSFYRNEEVASLLNRAKNVVDADKRKALYFKAQEVLHAEAPMIPLMYLPQMIAFCKEVHGYRVHPIGHVRLNKVWLSKK
ncbi:MAG: ABC transporter substrate-binding protein [Planctomycetota bacterium]|jgi:peptide/nickel transport system substrate-binding protein